MLSVSIIGIGRLGGALAIALSRHGFKVERLVHRDSSIAETVSTMITPRPEIVAWVDTQAKLTSDVILITTADPDIEVVASQLSGHLKPGAIVLHTSGSLSSDALSALASAGHSTGSMHPLVSVSDAVSGATNFPGAYFCIEGDDTAVNTARSMVEALGARPFSIASEYKPLYHAAAVMASGHLVALIDMSIEMLSKCGVEREAAQQILMPLIESTVNNLRTQSPARALTGSFARLDTSAVKRHLAAIDSQSSEHISNAYLLLGERSLDLATIGRPEAEEEELRKVISIAKRKSG